MRRRLGSPQGIGLKRALEPMARSAGNVEPVIRWLLAGDAAIRWQVLRDLLDSAEPAVMRERQKVARARDYGSTSFAVCTNGRPCASRSGGRANSCSRTGFLAPTALARSSNPSSNGSLFRRAGTMTCCELSIPSNQSGLRVIHVWRVPSTSCARNEGPMAAGHWRSTTRANRTSSWSTWLPRAVGVRCALCAS